MAQERLRLVRRFRTSWGSSALQTTTVNQSTWRRLPIPGPAHCHYYTYFSNRCVNLAGNIWKWEKAVAPSLECAGNEVGVVHARSFKRWDSAQAARNGAFLQEILHSFRLGFA